MTEFKCLKAVFVSMEVRACNSLLCYYTENDVSMKRLRLSFVNPSKGRSSHLQTLFKIGVHKNFANFTEKHLYWSLL